MKQNLHPDYTDLSAEFSRGNVLTMNSVLKKGRSVDVCSRCHPFYTSRRKTIDSVGRVERYRKRFGATAKTMEVGGR